MKWHPGAARWFEENAGADIADDMIHSADAHKMKRSCARRKTGTGPSLKPRPPTGRGLL
jgi:hypothetical protein